MYPAVRYAQYDGIVSNKGYLHIFHFFQDRDRSCCTWVTSEDVCAEKFTVMGTTHCPPSSTEGSRDVKRFWTMTVFPVPVIPVMNTGLFCFDSLYFICMFSIDYCGRTFRAKARSLREGGTGGKTGCVRVDSKQRAWLCSRFVRWYQQQNSGGEYELSENDEYNSRIRVDEKFWRAKTIFFRGGGTRRRLYPWSGNSWTHTGTRVHACRPRWFDSNV